MRRIIIPAVAAIVAAPAADAAVARVLQFDEKVKSADSIVLGEALRSASRFEGGGRWIVTETTFRVSRSLKGDESGEITVTTPGGTVGGLHQRTVGVPEFRAGDERVLFVKNDSTAQRTTILGLAQGTYEVTETPRSKVVEPLASDLILVDEKSGQIVGVDERSRTLEQFEAEVRAAMQERAPRIQAASSVKAPLVTTPRETRGVFSRFVDENRLVLALLAIGAILSAIPFFLKRR